MANTEVLGASYSQKYFKRYKLILRIYLLGVVDEYITKTVHALRFHFYLNRV